MHMQPQVRTTASSFRSFPALPAEVYFSGVGSMLQASKGGSGL